MLCVLRYFMTSIHRQSSEDLTFSFTETLPQTLWYVTASGANVLFYCQMSGQFLKYILPFLQDMTFNRVLNKQKEKISFHGLSCLGCCFEHMAAWKRLKKRNVRHKLNVHRIFSQILWLYDDIYIGICQIF